MKSFLSVLLLAVVAGIFFFFWGASRPALTVTPTSGAVGGAKELVVKLESPKGLKGLSVTALQGDRRIELLKKAYPPGARSARETLTLAAAGLSDGPFTLRIAAQGFSLLRLGGRTLEETHAFVFDNTPPVIAVLSTAHNIIRGGAGLVVYTISKEVEKTGVVVGNRFFPGYRQKGDFYACLFPYSFDMDPEHFVPRVTVVDRAGNERVATLNYHLLNKQFSTDTITLSDTFLEKISAEFKHRFPQAKTPLEIFLKANGELREQNRQALAEYGRQTSPTPLWQGDFLRMPNTAPLGGFAQMRTYVYQGQKVDQQIHLGFDLASVLHAPVPAANRGKVVFAGELGIYGQCVIIDHGLGLQTLYGHLSRIVVKAGEGVEKGQVIGNSGATGMAAGDHLHFGVVVSGQEVSPVEWWDAAWIRNNVTTKLELGAKIIGK